MISSKERWSVVRMPRKKKSPNAEQTKQAPEAEPQEQPGQRYDSTFKEWVNRQPAAILPLLLIGAVYLTHLDVERIKPVMRVDRVFKVLYKGIEVIFHIEFETGADPHILTRVRAYNALLQHEFQLPVISMIIYPFKAKLPESPYRVLIGEEEWNKMKFLVVPLFEANAVEYVKKHLISFYPILPAMQGVDEEMIEQIMKELAEFYGEDTGSLSEQFVAMRLILDRTTTIPEREKQKIRRRLMEYDPLWEENPRIRAERARSEAIGETRGELEASRRAVLTVVKRRFPSLAELAQQKVEQINKPDVLDYLIGEVAAAPDEDVARWVLRPIAA